MLQKSYLLLVTTLSIYLFGCFPAQAEITVEEILEIIEPAANILSCGASQQVTTHPEPLPSIVSRSYSFQYHCKYIPNVSHYEQVTEICNSLIRSGFGPGSIGNLITHTEDSCRASHNRSIYLLNCNTNKPESCRTDECNKSIVDRASCRVKIDPFENLEALESSTMEGTKNSCKLECNFSLHGYETTPAQSIVSCSGCTNTSLQTGTVRVD